MGGEGLSCYQGEDVQESRTSNPTPHHCPEVWPSGSSSSAHQTLTASLAVAIRSDLGEVGRGWEEAEDRRGEEGREKKEIR